MLSTVRYAVDEIRENYRRPTWWKQRIATRLIAPIQARFSSADGVDLLDESWDVLIVLDACRVDLFEEVADLDRFDSYDTRTSRGSATDEWTRANFSGRALSDTIYVTGNPVVSRTVQTAFFQFHEVWQDAFNSELGTVPAEAVTEKALEVHQAHPDKRLVLHYLQPHYPFVEDPDLQFATFGGTDELDVDHVRSGADDVWEAVGLGLVDFEEAWDAYRRNLEYVLDAIEPVLESVDGRVIITSDHGNLVGERVRPIPLKLYGHPPGVHHEMLRTVPWAVIDGKVRTERGVDDEEVKEKLRRLGYVE